MSTKQLPADLAKQVSLQDAREWADISGDHNRLHIDPEYARQTRFGQPILHGHLTVAWFMEWAFTWAGADWPRLGRISELRYLKPLYPGVQYTVRGKADTPRGTVRILVLLPGGDVGVEARLTLRNEEGKHV